MINSTQSITRWTWEEFIVVSAQSWLYETPVLWIWDRLLWAPPLPEPQNGRWHVISNSQTLWVSKGFYDGELHGMFTCNTREWITDSVSPYWSKCTTNATGCEKKGIQNRGPQFWNFIDQDHEPNTVFWLSKHCHWDWNYLQMFIIHRTFFISDNIIQQTKLVNNACDEVLNVAMVIWIIFDLIRVTQAKVRCK